MHIQYLPDPQNTVAYAFSWDVVDPNVTAFCTLAVKLMVSLDASCPTVNWLLSSCLQVIKRILPSGQQLLVDMSNGCLRILVPNKICPNALKQAMVSTTQV